MNILAWCVIAVLAPAAAAAAMPRRWLRLAGPALVLAIAALAARFWAGPQILRCGGGLCLDDALLAIALSGSTVLALLVLLGRCLWYRWRDRR